MSTNTVLIEIYAGNGEEQMFRAMEGGFGRWTRARCTESRVLRDRAMNVTQTVPLTSAMKERSHLSHTVHFQTRDRDGEEGGGESQSRE